MSLSAIQKNLLGLMENKYTVGVVCNKWGDTGKGKLVDILGAYWADINARGTGGANAGHTVQHEGEKNFFHIMPSCIQHDSRGVLNIIGRGVAFDSYIVKGELQILDDKNMSYNNLMIDCNARLVLPQHKLLDRIRNYGSDASKIGTTGKGIGYVYGDETTRIGLRVNDMLNMDRPEIQENLDKNIRTNEMILSNYDRNVVNDILKQDDLGAGRYIHTPENHSDTRILNRDAIIEDYSDYGKLFKPMISDAAEFIRSKIRKANLLGEGAQGVLLDVEYGTRPFVTASQPSARGLANGIGISESVFDIIFGIIKYYETRVGNGPFPTEFGGAKSDRHCAENNQKIELERYMNAYINDKDEFIRGVAVRQEGGEFGVTTGRLRRTGRLDLPLTRYAIDINGKDLVITKADVLNNMNEIEICTHYIYNGPDYFYGNRLLTKGTVLKKAIVDSNVLGHCEPVYTTFPGWKSDISNITEYDKLPKEFRNTVDFIEEQTGGNVLIVSVGPERNQTIIRPSAVA